MTEAAGRSDAGRGNRRRDILEALARELERNPGERITTAALARSVGVSEAALYRHFASKGQMYDALIEFVEDSLFGRINQILKAEDSAEIRCQHIVHLLLGFAARNPGLTRVLTGEALVGERARLRERVAQLFARLETQIKQVLREGELTAGVGAAASIGAEILVAFALGRMQRFVHGGFERPPLTDWEAQWAALRRGLFDRGPSIR